MLHLLFSVNVATYLKNGKIPDKRILLKQKIEKQIYREPKLYQKFQKIFSFRQRKITYANEIKSQSFRKFSSLLFVTQCSFCKVIQKEPIQKKTILKSTISKKPLLTTFITTQFLKNIYWNFQPKFLNKIKGKLLQ